MSIINSILEIQNITNQRSIETVPFIFDIVAGKIL